MNDTVVILAVDLSTPSVFFLDIPDGMAVSPNGRWVLSSSLYLSGMLTSLTCSVNSDSGTEAATIKVSGLSLVCSLII